MLIECPTGQRLRDWAECWEWRRKRILGDDSINFEKQMIERQRTQKATLLGFEINTEDISVQLHEAKIQQARTLVLRTDLAPGNNGAAVATLQHLRGLRVRWLTCNLFRRCLFQPIDLLLSHTGESGSMICCGGSEIWMSFFNAPTMARSMAESATEWALLSKCALGGLQVTHARLSGTVENPYAVWTSGDAAIEKMAGINWETAGFSQLGPVGLMKDFHQGQLRAYTIGEIELTESVGVASFWGDLWNGRQIILLGAADQNTVSWAECRSANR